MVSLSHCVSHSQTERAQLEGGRFVYRLLRSPMCEYLVNFLHKLRQLPERYMMNSVLENFTILQVIRWGRQTLSSWGLRGPHSAWRAGSGDSKDESPASRPWWGWGWDNSTQPACVGSSSSLGMLGYLSF